MRHPKNAGGAEAGEVAKEQQRSQRRLMTTTTIPNEHEEEAYAGTIPVIAYIALGSNLEDPQQQVRQGFDELAKLIDSKLLACSSLYSSKPVGYVDQPDFVNAVAKLETALSPREL